MQHLFAGGGQALRHDDLAVLPALAHALVQRLARGRQDEDADRIGHLLAHLACALPVDFQQDVVAGGQLRLHRLPRSALPVAMHQRVFEEIARFDHALELVGGDEMVVLGMAFARPRRARGERDRQGDLRVACQGGVDDAALAGARGGRNDIESAAHF